MNSEKMESYGIIDDYFDINDEHYVYTIINKNNYHIELYITDSEEELCVFIDGCELGNVKFLDKIKISPNVIIPINEKFYAWYDFIKAVIFITMIKINRKNILNMNAIII